MFFLGVVIIGEYKGKFITFEGPEGGGKTSQLWGIADYLKDQGLEVVVTREPGGTNIGDQVRLILMKLSNTSMHPNTEFLLFQGSRAQHVNELIIPTLEQGGIVLCDRYSDSSLAYQGYGHEMDLEMLKLIINFATRGLKPDLTLLLDLDPGVGLKRRATQSEQWNRLDAYDLAFHERVRQGYLTMATAEPERYRMIDASQTMNNVKNQIRVHLDTYFGFR